MGIENNIKIAIVIPFFNGDNFISNCLQSLSVALERTELNYVIIIVENNYRKSALFNNIERDHLEVIETKPGIGFGRACNIGAIHAHKKEYAHVMFLNQDTEIELDFFKLLVSSQYFVNADTIIFPLIYNLKKRKALYDIPYNEYFNDYSGFKADFENNKLQNYYELKVYSGCCFIISTSKFIDLGLFDPIYYMYGEDYDFFWRAKSQACQLIMLSGLKVFHSEKLERTVKDRIVVSKRLIRERLINYIRWNNYYSIKYQLKYIIRNSALNFIGLLFILIETLFSYKQLKDKDSNSISQRAFDHYNIDFISNESVRNNTGF